MTFHLRLKRISKPNHTRLKFDLEKLKDPNVLETFQAMIAGSLHIKQNNHRFADDIDGLAGEGELAKLVERLDKAFTAYGMEISTEETKLMTNNTSGINK